MRLFVFEKNYKNNQNLVNEISILHKRRTVNLIEKCFRKIRITDYLLRLFYFVSFFLFPLLPAVQHCTLKYLLNQCYVLLNSAYCRFILSTSLK
jgi:hypothetical protein